jgi:hypothetical protein
MEQVPSPFSHPSITNLTSENSHRHQLRPQTSFKSLRKKFQVILTKSMNASSHHLRNDNPPPSHSSMDVDSEDDDHTTSSTSNNTNCGSISSSSTRCSTPRSSEVEDFSDHLDNLKLNGTNRSRGLERYPEDCMDLDNNENFQDCGEQIDGAQNDPNIHHALAVTPQPTLPTTHASISPQPTTAYNVPARFPPPPVPSSTPAHSHSARRATEPSLTSTLPLASTISPPSSHHQKPKVPGTWHKSSHFSLQLIFNGSNQSESIADEVFNRMHSEFDQWSTIPTAFFPGQRISFSPRLRILHSGGLPWKELGGMMLGVSGSLFASTCSSITNQ